MRDVTTFTNSTVYANDVYYLPFIDEKDGRVGYIVRSNRENDGNQQEKYVYLNPSTSTAVFARDPFMAEQGALPDVFVYMGAENDPGNDTVHGHFVIDLDEED